MRAFHRGRAALFGCAGALSYLCLLFPPPASDGRLQRGEYGVLARYLSALQAHRYGEAFALLSDDERTYFGSASNFASAYAADRLALRSYRIVASARGSLGTLVYVDERVQFYEYAHRAPVSLRAKVAYAVVGSESRPRVKDPNHPWRALAPADCTLTSRGLRVTLDKVSFFTGRLELVATFANVGDGIVTLLPYGNSAARDDRGRRYLPIASRSPGLTDRALFAGLRLPANARYTGTLSFATPNRFSPKALFVTFAPALRDGADAPFAMALPALAVPPANDGRP